MTDQAFEITFVIISNYTKYKSLKAENMLQKNFKLLPWPIGPLHSYTHNANAILQMNAKRLPRRLARARMRSTRARAT